MQDIPNAIPLEMWYDAGFSPTGTATINLWPGPLASYQLELYTWQQLTQFADTTTAYGFPPGYASAIIWSLAERIAPMMRIYCKIPADEWAEIMPIVVAQADKARAAVQGKNQVDIMSACDPAYLTRNGGAFNWLTGGFGRGL